MDLVSFEGIRISLSWEAVQNYFTPDFAMRTLYDVVMILIAIGSYNGARTLKLIIEN
jgi:hypothetical protein